MTQLEQYSKQIAEELNITDFNVNDVQLRTPARKHFWVARLINHKVELNKQKSLRSKLKKDITKKILEESPIKMSFASAEKSVDNTKDMITLNEKIQELEILIEYLEKVEKIYSSLTWDLKNITELRKSETM